MPHETYDEMVDRLEKVEKLREEAKKAASRDTGWAKIYKKWLVDDWEGTTTMQRMVLIVLVAYGAKFGKCFVGIRKIAAMVAADKDTVKRNLQQLQKKGFIEISKKRGCNNLYRILK